jgi:hypothetical protein
MRQESTEANSIPPFDALPKRILFLSFIQFGSNVCIALVALLEKPNQNIEPRSCFEAVASIVVLPRCHGEALGQARHDRR